MIHLIVIMTVLAFTHMFCFAIMSELKYSVKKTAIIYCATAVLFVILVALSYLFFCSDIVTAFAVSYGITITICFFVFLFTSTDSIDKKIFLYISYSNVFCILWGVSDILCSTFCNGLSVIQTMYAKNLIRTLMTIPLICLYIKYLRPLIRSIPAFEKNIWASFSLTSTLFLFVFSSLISGLYEKIFHQSGHILIFTVFLIIYSSVLWVVFGNIQQMSSENKLKLIAQKAKYLQSELEIARQNEVIAKRMKHDYRHHLQNILAMLKNGDVEHAVSYIDQYNSSLDYLNRKEICPNVTVNAILTSFHNIAQNNGISFSAVADTPKHSIIADTDFVAILSNLLENAINGCKECGADGGIKINIKTIENKTVIVCSNPCRDNIAIVNHMIKNKGIGIDSIVASSRKYCGDISYKQDNGILTVCIILKH